MKQIPDNILETLKRGTVLGNTYRLPEGQLDRKTYEACDKVLGALGGKWNRKQKAHVFPRDIEGDLSEVLATGEMPAKNPLAYFPTPDPIVEMMLEKIRLGKGWLGEDWTELRILEPSGGEGAILDAIAHRLEGVGGRANPFAPNTIVQMYTCELDEHRADVLESKGYDVVGGDFLGYNGEYGESYDLIIMNPPFAVEGNPTAYVDHIYHAWNMLATGGELVSIAPASLAFRNDAKTRELREFIQSIGGTIETLPDDAFKVSGTLVRTVMVHMKGL